MKKNTIVLVIVLVAGLITGSLLGQLLSPWVPFLTKSVQVTWEPKANLDIVKYDLNFQVKLNLANVVGFIGAFWIYRKL